MKVTESSESVLAGTKRPPFRLVCRALSASGMRMPIRPAVSEEFVVSPAQLLSGRLVLLCCHKQQRTYRRELNV